MIQSGEGGGWRVIPILFLYDSLKKEIGKSVNPPPQRKGDGVAKVSRPLHTGEWGSDHGPSREEAETGVCCEWGVSLSARCAGQLDAVVLCACVERW